MNPTTKNASPATSTSDAKMAPGGPASGHTASHRRYVLIGAFVLVVVFVGLLLWSIVLRPLTVTVARVEKDVPEQVFGLGTVGARVQSNLGFKVSGVLVSIMADQGQHARAGQILARLDARDVEAQLVVAKANIAQAHANIEKANAGVLSATASLANAKAVAERSERLIKAGGVSEEQMQTDAAALRIATANLAVAQSDVAVYKSALRSAEAQEASQRATLNYYSLSAPYDGWIISRNLELGSSPNPGQSVFTMVAANTIWILAYVDERLAGHLTVGQPALITLRSGPHKTLAGHVARIEIQSDPVNEERLVDIAFDRPPLDVHLAEQAEVVITTGQMTHTVTVPPTAVSDLQDGHGVVWTVEDGRLARRPVTFGRELLNGRLPIVGGLPESAAVVVTPVPRMRVGRAVHVAQELTR
jgi:HlyD family secretion protein